MHHRGWQTGVAHYGQPQQHFQQYKPAPVQQRTAQRPQEKQQIQPKIVNVTDANAAVQPRVPGAPQTAAASTQARTAVNTALRAASTAHTAARQLQPPPGVAAEEGKPNLVAAAAPTTTASSTSTATTPAKAGAASASTPNRQAVGTPGTASHTIASQASVARAAPATPTTKPATAAARPAASVHMADPTLRLGIGLEFDAKTMTVTTVMPGLGAARSGEVKVGDELIAVEGREVADFKAAKELILGRQGTLVAMSFRRRGQRFQVKLMRGSREFFLLSDRAPQGTETPLKTSGSNSSSPLSKSGASTYSHTPSHGHTPSHSSHGSHGVSDEIATFQKKIMDLQVVISQVHTRNSKLEQDLMTEREKHKLTGSQDSGVIKKMQDIHLLELQVDSLQAQLHDKDAFYAEAQHKQKEEHESMLKRISELEGLLSERMASKNARITELNEELACANKQIEELRKENQTSRESMLTAKSTTNEMLQELQKENEELRRGTQELGERQAREAREASRKLDDANKEIEHLRKENKALQEKLLIQTTKDLSSQFIKTPHKPEEASWSSPARGMSPASNPNVTTTFTTGAAPQYDHHGARPTTSITTPSRFSTLQKDFASPGKPPSAADVAPIQHHHYAHTHTQPTPARMQQIEPLQRSFSHNTNINNNLNQDPTQRSLSHSHNHQNWQVQQVQQQQVQQPSAPDSGSYPPPGFEQGSYPPPGAELGSASPDAQAPSVAPSVTFSVSSAAGDSNVSPPSTQDVIFSVKPMKAMIGGGGQVFPDGKRRDAPQQQQSSTHGQPYGVQQIAEQAQPQEGGSRFGVLVAGSTIPGPNSGSFTRPHSSATTSPSGTYTASTPHHGNVGYYSPQQKESPAQQQQQQQQARSGGAHTRTHGRPPTSIQEQALNQAHAHNEAHSERRPPPSPTALQSQRRPSTAHAKSPTVGSPQTPIVPGGLSPNSLYPLQLSPNSLHHLARSPALKFQSPHFTFAPPHMQAPPMMGYQPQYSVLGGLGGMPTWGGY